MLRHFRTPLFLLLCCLAAPAVAAANGKTSTLPHEYTVKKGDTLWDIASRFLKNPWKWLNIWERNPFVGNPDLIYPGDVLLFDERNGALHLKVLRAGPQAQVLPLMRDSANEAIPVVQPELILPFLRRPGVIDPAEYSKLPYILSSKEDRVIFARDDILYAKGLDQQSGQRLDVVRLGGLLKDPVTQAVLGQRIEHMGMAEAIDNGDPRRIRLLAAYKEIHVGDRLLPQSDVDAQLRLIPQVPEQPLRGILFAAEENINELGQSAVAMINIGSEAGAKAGHILNVYRAGRSVIDPISKLPLTLPEENVGTLMLFRIFPKLSYALVVQSREPIRLGDVVHNPDSAPVSASEEWKGDDQR